MVRFFKMRAVECFRETVTTGNKGKLTNIVASLNFN